jgi:Skp family chaperone for outer membrane proteins
LELAAAQVLLKNMRRQLEQWRARVAKAQSVLEAKEEEALEELKRGISKARFRVAEAQGVVLEAQAVLAVVDEVPTNEEANEEANEHYYC